MKLILAKIWLSIVAIAAIVGLVHIPVAGWIAIGGTFGFIGAILLTGWSLSKIWP